ncbi:hypothetical protein HET73_06685 [Wolbachia endosymbiont of Atemnus politus]|uniref:hypothetical protein n=1 Tax=Wolbachia endosymbiont of Atemnus politus TaxID=2682840 RepID=UPI001574079D|nr:hypothetical protein [Wolbachia endosymbiont of Atemnus politus]NSM56979.1 hypothetical protein [Wolbachia endosymbiont of Atemnus politus]NSX83679.1 hypothetical protein [Wolbachia endosymbiont of Atemnus politus]
MSENNSKKELNEKNEPREQKEGSGGSFIELLKSIIKALFNSVVDLPQQGQNEMKSIDQQQNLDRKGKSPEDLKPEKKLEVKEAAEGLKERLQKSDVGNQSVGIEVPNQTSGQDIDSSKAMER